MSILITGATSGLGEELAKQLQGKKKLLLTGRNSEKLNFLKQTLQGEVECLSSDLSKDHLLILNWIEKEKPELIFNNAGFGLYGPFDELQLEEIEAMIQVNCVALTKITHLAIKLWRSENKKGTVMNISSFGGIVPMPLGSLYGATKAFVTQFSESLDIEYSKFGIRVLAACPGMVDTEFSKRASRLQNGKVNSSTEKSVMMSSQNVVRKILKQVETKQRMQIIDGRYQLLHLISKGMPRKLIGLIIAHHLKKRL